MNAIEIVNDAPPMVAQPRPLATVATPAQLLQIAVERGAIALICLSPFISSRQ